MCFYYLFFHFIFLSVYLMKNIPFLMYLCLFSNSIPTHFKSIFLKHFMTFSNIYFYNPVIYKNFRFTGERFVNLYFFQVANNQKKIVGRQPFIIVNKLNKVYSQFIHDFWKLKIKTGNIWIFHIIYISLFFQKTIWEATFIIYKNFNSYNVENTQSSLFFSHAPVPLFVVEYLC